MAGLGSTLRAIARRLPGVEEGVACKGTALESVTCQVGKKAFLFVGATVARLKLQESLGEAQRLQAKQPAIEASASGWVKLSLDGKAPPVSVLERWVGESYALFAAPKATSTKAVKPRRRGR